MALRIVKLVAPPSGEGAAAQPEDGPGARPLGDLENASLTGPLGAGLGGKLLMHLFTEERTGRLVVTDASGAKKTLCIVAGEPVHVVFSDGGAALEQRLRKRGVLKEPTAHKPRHPLAGLLRRSDPISVLEALREEVREFGAGLLAATDGSWSFYDDRQFLDWTPLTPVNPFGFVLDARRRTMPPQQLLGLADEIGASFVAPTVDLAIVTGRLKAFTGGTDLADVIDGTRRASEVIQAAQLDAMMGSLVLRTLADSELVRLQPFQPAAPETMRRRSRAQTAPSMLQPDARQLSALAAAPKGGVEILALYLDIKPERDDNAILGVEGSAGLASIERGYQQRLAELDARAIADGPNRPFLLARAEELREKIERAYQTRMANRPRAKLSAAYQILDKIGVGGMAEVFRGVPADDPTHFVAIKVVLPEMREDPRFAQMFLEEARLARRIQHPNVVRVLSVGVGSEDLYLAMEYVDGFDFGELLRRGHEQGRPARFDVVCRIVAEACAGLHAAHTAHDRTGSVTPILHRDVSPQNILVSRTGEVKLSDFGIAKAMDTQDEEAGVVKGKIPYLAPELLRGTPASVRSDIYAMAMTVYAAFSGLPFQRADRLETMRAILNDPLPPLSTLAPGIPPILDAILMTAAAKNPDDRHASAQQLQLELEEILALRPPVDVALWARPLAGGRMDPGAPTRPITTVRSSTGLTGVANITASHARPTTTSLPPRAAIPSIASEPEVEVDLDDL